MGLTKHEVSQKTPHAAVIIWNYKYRLGSDLDLTNAQVNDTDVRIVSTLSCISIQTSKTKSHPAGNFTIQMAPYKNWVGEITPGSWMVILMSQKKITAKDLDRASPSKVKFFGRIESVRVSVTANETGARQTVYTVTGKDWGTIFENIIYIDSLAQGEGGAIGNATALGLAFLFAEKDDSGVLQSARDMLRGLLGLWGAPLGLDPNSIHEGNLNIILKPSATFTIPSRVSSFFGFDTKHPEDTQDLLATKGLQKLNSLLPDSTYDANTSHPGPKTTYDYTDSSNFHLRNVVDTLHLSTGIVTNNTKWLCQPVEPPESYGYINLSALIGQHTIWQVLQDHACPMMNELFCDLSFPQTKGRAPMLTLFNRIKPFYIKPESENYQSLSNHKGDLGNTKDANPDLVKKYISRFDNVRMIPIPTADIINFEGGTNWRDKVNFVEVRSAINDETLMKDATHAVIKLNAQIADQYAFQREGFRPMIAATKQLPRVEGDAEKEGGINAGLRELVSWKYLLREWYFDTHRMLNGTVTFLGQDEYIRIGDNILISADILSATNNYNALHRKYKQNTNLLLHVESVSQSFTVGGNGERHWATTVQFVRGIAVGSNGKILPFGNDKDNDPRTDRDASKLDEHQDRNLVNTVSTSTEQDPDPQKKRGD